MASFTDLFNSFSGNTGINPVKVKQNTTPATKSAMFSTTMPTYGSLVKPTFSASAPTTPVVAPKQTPTALTFPKTNSTPNTSIASNALVAGVDTNTKSIEQILADYAKAQTATQTPELQNLQAQNTNFYNDYKAVTDKLNTEAARTQELQAQYGTEADYQKLRDINNQIAAKSAEYKTAEEALRNRSGVLAPITDVAMDDLRRKQALDIGLLDIQRTATQGNYDAAKARITDLIKLEFDPLRQQLSNLKGFYDMNKDSLSKAESAQANKIKLIYETQKEQLDTNEANKSKNLNLMLEVIRNGGNPALVNMNKTPEENMMNARGALVDKKATDSGVDYQVFNLGGKYVRIGYDKNGNEVSRKDVGPAGDVSGTDLKATFNTYVTQLPDGAKTKDELSKAAGLFGLNPTDKDVKALIDSYKAKGTGKFLGIFGKGY